MTGHASRRPAGRGSGLTAQLLPRVPDAVFVLVLLAIATVPLGAVYANPAFVVVGVGALVLGTAIALGCAVRGLPLYAVAALTVVVYLVVGVPLAVPTEATGRILPTISGFRDLVSGTGSAWKKMVSVSLPLGDYEALLVPALVVLLVATVVALTVALRTRRPGWAVVPAVGVLVFGIAVGGTGAVSVRASGGDGSAGGLTSTASLAAGIAFAVVSLVWAARSVVIAGGSFARIAAAFVLIVVTVGGGGALVAAHPPWTSRQVLRTAFVPPFDPSHEVSPLVGYRNSVLAPSKSSAMLTVKGLPSGARVRVVTLDDYDGLVFAVGDGSASPSSGTFARVPSRIDRSGDAGTKATVKVTVDGYRGVWLPTVGDLSSVAFGAAPKGATPDENVFVNEATSTAAVRGGVVAGETYSVTTVVPTMQSLSRVASLSPGDAVQPKSESLPTSLAAIVKAHGGGGSPGSQLAAITTWLRTGYVSNSGPKEPFSAAGHSAGRLQSLLTTTPMLGDAEQYAPALALLARQIGFPSRVVVGYAPGASDGGAAAGAKSSQTEVLDGSDLTAWVEVETSAGRWVGIDPNPEPRTVPSKETKPTESIARPQTVLPPPPPSRVDTAVTQNRDGQKTKPAVQAPAWLRILLAILGVAWPILLVAAIVLAPFWGIALARLLRRRRRRRHDLGTLVIGGAWNEVQDAVHDSGYPVARAATRSEIAAEVGTPEIVRLADAAERSVFSRQVLTRDDVDDFWRASAAARRSVLDTANGRWQRVRFHLTASSLLVSLRGWWVARSKRSRRDRTGTS